MTRTMIGALAALALGLAACNGGGGGDGSMASAMPEQRPMAAAVPAMPTQRSLYDRLGGKPAITAVVDDFVGNVVADKRINRRFAHANIPYLKYSLVGQVCQATGGPCMYSGPDMRSVHTGMHITDDEFGSLVGDLKKSLDKFKVPEAEQNELLTVLGRMRPDIVGT